MSRKEIHKLFNQHLKNIGMYKYRLFSVILSIYKSNDWNSSRIYDGCCRFCIETKILAPLQSLKILQFRFF